MLFVLLQCSVARRKRTTAFLLHCGFCGMRMIAAPVPGSLYDDCVCRREFSWKGGSRCCVRSPLNRARSTTIWLSFSFLCLESLRFRRRLAHVTERRMQRAAAYRTDVCLEKNLHWLQGGRSASGRGGNSRWRRGGRWGRRAPRSPKAAPKNSEHPVHRMKQLVNSSSHPGSAVSGREHKTSVRNFPASCLMPAKQHRASALLPSLGLAPAARARTSLAAARM